MNSSDFPKTPSRRHLDKALRYRLLNEPAEAESICRDVLSIDPDNQQALVTLLLALTDRFDEGYAVGATQAQEVLSRLARCSTSGPITPASSASARPRRGCIRAIPAPAMMPTNS